MKAIKAHRPAHWQAFAKATVGLFAVVIAVATCTDALAMRHHLKLLAWSSDGASALLANKVRDREGGGALGYRVIRADGKTDLRLEVSKLTNPGAGSKRQRVTRKRCLRRLGQLRSTLRRLRFRGVGVVASACAGKERSGLVEIDDITAGTRERQHGFEFLLERRQLGEQVLRLIRCKLFGTGSTQFNTPGTARVKGAIFASKPSCSSSMNW